MKFAISSNRAVSAAMWYGEKRVKRLDFNGSAQYSWHEGMAILPQGTRTSTHLKVRYTLFPHAQLVACRRRPLHSIILILAAD